jgi:hypothetical protein
VNQPLFPGISQNLEIRKILDRNLDLVLGKAVNHGSACLMLLSTIFQFYLGGNISFIEGGNQSKSSTYILPPMSYVTLGENKWQKLMLP